MKNARAETFVRCNSNNLRIILALYNGKNYFKKKMIVINIEGKQVKRFLYDKVNRK